MAKIVVMPGTPGLQLHEVAHILPIGRGRDKTGYWISDFTVARVEYAAMVYNLLGLARVNGRFCCSGGATPFDTNGEPWWHMMREQYYNGRPEAVSMAEIAHKLGIPSCHVREEPDSWDTVTNIVFTEKRRLLGDDRPMAIVAHEAHLERALKVAKRIARRPYLGIVVPEGMRRDRDGLAARLATHAMLFGLHPYMQGKYDVYDKACRQSQIVWRLLGKTTTVPEF
jgi:uncharacterized SAM-binding protein YcdF (DUF218 family)